MNIPPGQQHFNPQAMQQMMAAQQQQQFHPQMAQASPAMMQQHMAQAAQQQQQRARAGSAHAGQHHGSPMPAGGSAGSASSSTPAKRRGPSGHAVAAAAAAGGGASAAAMAALSHPMPHDEEDTSHGDFLDFVTPREIATHRYQLMHEYMEEVFSSPYKASQIVDDDDPRRNLVLAVRLRLTDGIFDTNGVPTDGMTKEQACEKVSERAQKMIDDTQKEIATMEARQKRTVEKFQKRGEVLRQVYKEQRKESYDVWNEFARELGVPEADPSHARGGVGLDHDLEPRSPEELTKVVEDLYSINIELDRPAVKVVAEGQGYISEEMRRAAEAEAEAAQAAREKEQQDVMMAGVASPSLDSSTLAGGDNVAAPVAAAEAVAADLLASPSGKDPVAVIPIVIGNIHNNAVAPAEPIPAIPATAATAAAAATAASSTTPTALATTSAPSATTPAAGTATTPSAPATSDQTAQAPAAPAEAHDNDTPMMDAHPELGAENKDLGDNLMEDDPASMFDNPSAADDAFADIMGAAVDLSSSNSANMTPISAPVPAVLSPHPAPTGSTPKVAPEANTPAAPPTAENAASTPRIQTTQPDSAAGTPTAPAITDRSPTPGQPATGGTPQPTGGLTPTGRTPAPSVPSPLPNTATPEREQKFKEPTPSAVEPSAAVNPTDEPPTVPGEEFVPEDFLADVSAATSHKSPSLLVKSPSVPPVPAGGTPAAGTPAATSTPTAAAPGQEGGGDAAAAGTPAALVDAAAPMLDVPGVGEQQQAVASSPKPQEPAAGGDAPPPA